jgi:hypothetical protein
MQALKRSGAGRSSGVNHCQGLVAPVLFRRRQTPCFIELQEAGRSSEVDNDHLQWFELRRHEKPQNKATFPAARR